MSYPVENALFQWEDGERRLAQVEEPEVRRALDTLVQEIRKLLGGTFSVHELADLYADSPDLGDAPVWLLDAAFARYAREAYDFSGGSPRT